MLTPKYHLWMHMLVQISHNVIQKLKATSPSKSITYSCFWIVIDLTILDSKYGKRPDFILRV